MLPLASVVVLFSITSASANAAAWQSPVEHINRGAVRRLGWNVFHKEQPVLHAGGLIDHSVALDVVVLQWHTNDASICHAACEGLMQHIAAEVAGQGVTAIRTLALESQSSFPTSGLQASDFKARAALQEWTTSATAVSRIDSSGVFQRVPLTVPLTAEQTGQIRHLLQSCLEDSQDLRELATPTAESLLSTWQTLHGSEIVLLSVSGVPAGLAVVSRERDRRQATLEYTGVAPVFRRRGWGHQLVHQIQSALVTDAPAVTTTLSAWCDRENLPGMQLYRKCGFRPGQPGRLWVRLLSV